MVSALGPRVASAFVLLVGILAACAASPAQEPRRFAEPRSDKVIFTGHCAGGRLTEAAAWRCAEADAHVEVARFVGRVARFVGTRSAYSNRSEGNDERSRHVASGRTAGAGWETDVTWEWGVPAVAQDGTAFVGVEEFEQIRRVGAVYAFATDGTPLWRLGTASAMTSAATIGPDGVVYLGSKAGYLYAVYGKAGGLAGDGWPTLRGGAANTGREGGR